MYVIERLNETQVPMHVPQLVALLCDAVDDGASVGFLRPMDTTIAKDYWDEIVLDINKGARILLIARQDADILGSVQLGLCLRPNGTHRAEVQKLLVQTRYRRQGIARALMHAIEQQARIATRSLLYLDTEPDQPAERLYSSLGWIQGGAIPNYACTPDGQLHATTLFYKPL